MSEHTMKRMRTVCAVTIAAAFAAGCAGFAPEYKRPEAELPAAWGVSGGASAAPLAKGDRWWSVYNDAVLERLIDEALAGNANLLIAAARVEEARGVLGVSDTERQPQVTGSFNRSRTLTTNRGTFPLPPTVPREQNDYRATLNVSYELDFWGRLKNANAAARAELLASEAARDTVRISLASDVAQGYFALRSYDGQIETVRRVIAGRGEALEIQKKRLGLGDISEYELRQREAELAAAKSQLPSLQRARAVQENALAVLLGRSPKLIYEGRLEAGRDAGHGADSGAPPPAPLASVSVPALAPVVPAGLPSDLLLRRPDIVEAEQRLIAANARIGVARAMYFPGISLTGFVGSESVALTDLFTGPAGIWQAALALSQPVWGGGRLDAQVQQANARRQQALGSYQKTLQTAFREVRDALAGQTSAREQLQAESERAQALRETLRLARLRYDNGMANQLEVLDAERGLLAAEQNRIDALRAQRAAIADLFKALGGGWN